MTKVFELDWDNPSDLKKHISLLQKRRKMLLQKLGYNEIRFNGSTKYNIQTVLPQIEEVFKSIDSQPGEHYVYMHCNPMEKLDIIHNLKHLFLGVNFPVITHVPFYVGKGIGNRYMELNRNDSHRKIRTQILKFKQDILPVKIIEKVSEETAHTLENFFMYFLGLRALSGNGLLVNLAENTIDDFPKNETFKMLMRKNNFRHI